MARDAASQNFAHPALLNCLGARALARTSAEYALLGRRVWAAFECAALAGIAGDADQQKRLFTLGYEQGKTFIEALRSGKIERQDLTREVDNGEEDYS